MSNTKKLSNPFSTGGGGVNFENHVQASFVTLMLTCGHAPYLPCWPIVEMKLQGKIDGYNTDDIIVFVENAENKERCRLLGQIKHSIAITQGNPLFSEVMRAAWKDFTNPEVFTKGKDIITLVTGPLSATDEHNVQWLLNQARYTKNVDEFFRYVEQANFSPSKTSEKLQVIQHHLTLANKGNEISRDELYDFLKHFHILDYDLDNESGVVLSLLHSHISQFNTRDPQWIWSRIVDIVKTWNQNAGTITFDKLPEDLKEAFRQKVTKKFPKNLLETQEIPKTNWTQHPNATYLALALLLGTWNEKYERDKEIITQLLDIDYNTWLQKAREILHQPGNPLSLKNGIWRVTNRVDLLNLVGSHILDQNLDTFISIAITILREPDPAFELPTNERYAASIRGKVLTYSQELRNGIAEGLAILGSQPDACSNCSQGKVESICIIGIREILSDADWVLWGSLNSLLPILAEAAPSEFLDRVEKTLSLKPCPFEELFAEEGNGIFGGHYLTGLLWALECLAWDEQYLVRVCVILSELASHDPGGQLKNRPFNSLITIFLPWFPQTLASIDKRKVAIETLYNEYPDITWNLIIQLLPNQHRVSSGSYQPRWRKTIPDNWKEGVTPVEYRQQISLYAEYAISAANHDTIRLSELIDHFNNLPKSGFEQLVEVLSSKPILELPENQKSLLWDHLTKFAIKHRRFSDTDWALPEKQIIQIENIIKQLTPTNPFMLYQYLFCGNDYDLYDETDNWEEQQKRLDSQRETSISEILQQDGINGVIRFSESVTLPYHVGYALANVADIKIEKALFPRFLDAENNKHSDFVRGFIWKRYHINGWKWCDNIDKTGWTPKQKGYFLSYLPFTMEAWTRASQWLGKNQVEYWSLVTTLGFQADSNGSIAVEKLIEYGRPHSAINCLVRILNKKQPISVEQCVRALLAALSSSEPAYVLDKYNIIELIKYLQSEPLVDQEDLFHIEWAYLPLLDHFREAAPKLLESRLASDPEFFCEIIRLIYKSKIDHQSSKERTEVSEKIAKNAWQLLYVWKTPPGIQNDNTFNEEHFNKWLQQVKHLCIESGHFEVALISIGNVLIHAPSDPDGLWIHRAIATALNSRDAEDMRRGYSTGVYNSRGVHWVDPTGKPERDLAEQYRRKAEDVENAGFQRFATSLRNMAESYERDAERVIDEHNDHEDD